MPNLMRRHMQRLDDVCREVMRDKVDYRRGARQFTVLATIGSSDHEQLGSDDVMTHYRTVDFIVTAADISAMGEPQRGDVIVSSHDGTRREYEVVPVGESQHLFRRSDEFGIAYRIHTTPRAINGQYP